MRWCLACRRSRARGVAAACILRKQLLFPLLFQFLLPQPPCAMPAADVIVGLTRAFAQRQERADAAAARSKPMRVADKKSAAPARGRNDGPTMRVRVLRPLVRGS